MKTDDIFAGMPMLSIVTNFAHNGDFERIYLVMERQHGAASQNYKRKASPIAAHSHWNGPLGGLFQQIR